MSSNNGVLDVLVAVVAAIGIAVAVVCYVILRGAWMGVYYACRPPDSVSEFYIG